MMSRLLLIGVGWGMVTWGAGPACALMGSGDSATGLLETVRPTVGAAISSPEGQSLAVTFSEPVDADALSGGSYSITGAGAGTVAANPDSVVDLGSNARRLVWSSGSMVWGAPVTVTVSSGVQDLRGNPIDTSGDEATGLAVPVELSVFTAEGEGH